MLSQPPCDQCGSTNFEEDNGILICERGHHQEGGQRIGEDDGDFGTAGKVSRKKNIKEKQKIVRVYHGAKGYQLFLKAWQYIMWKQCHYLVQRVGMPAELWNVVRELWSLRLTKLAARAEDANPIFTHNDHEGHDQSELTSNNVDASETKPRKTVRLAEDSPTLWETIGFNCLGILLLRQPLHLELIYECLRNESMCFIRAIRSIPQEMKDRLAGEYHNALDTTTISKQVDLQMAVYRTAAMFTTSFGMSVPPLNWNLMLLTYMKKLALPLEVSGAAKHIIAVLQFDFRYHIQPDTRRSLFSFPEAQLMSAVVVATKLLFPFDAHTVCRQPYRATEPAALCMRWDAWLHSMKQQRAQTDPAQPLGPQDAITVTDADVFDMTNEEIDQYMNWFQNTYTSEPRGNSNMMKQVINMFPLIDLPSKPVGEDDLHNQKTLVADLLHSTQSNLEALKPTSQQDAQNMQESNPDIIRPGQKYRQYRIQSELTSVALAFHQEAANIACLELDLLLRAVYRTERLLMHTQVEQRRAAAFAGEFEGDSE